MKTINPINGRGVGLAMAGRLIMAARMCAHMCAQLAAQLVSAALLASGLSAAAAASAATRAPAAKAAATATTAGRSPQAVKDQGEGRRPGRVEAGLLASLRSRFPGTQFHAVRASAVPGLYEVVMGSNIALVSPSNLRYLMFGRVLDTVTMQDITAPRLAHLPGQGAAGAAPARPGAGTGADAGVDGPRGTARQAGTDSDDDSGSGSGPLDAPRRAGQSPSVDVKALPITDAIKTVQGRGQRQLFVFSDPACGFCRRLHEELVRIDDVTIHTFVVPFQDPQLARSIWCAPDRAAAWASLMSPGQIASPGSSPGSSRARWGTRPCADPMQRNLDLAARLGVQATPTLVFADGGRLAGAVPASAIERRMGAALAGRAPPPPPATTPTPTVRQEGPP